MYRLIFLVLISLCMQTGKAQQAVSLLPVTKNGKWGFIDLTGKIVIVPGFDQVGSFNGQIAAVQKNNLFYLIDTTGAFVFKEGYEDLNIINKEFVAIRKTRFALADRKGNIYSDFSYTFISENNLSTLSLRTDTNSYNLFNAITYKLLPDRFSKFEIHPKEKYIDVKQNDKVGLLDSLHHYILRLVPGVKAFLDNGAAIVKTKDGFQIYKDSTSICGDTLVWKGYKVLSSKFIEAWNNPAKKYILSVVNGKQFPFFQFITCEALEKTPLLVVINGKKRGLLNAEGESVIPIENDHIKVEKDSTIRYVKNGKIGMLTWEGKTIFPQYFDWIGEFNENGIALAMKDSLLGIVNRIGKILVAFKYDDIEITNESWKAYRNNSMDLYVLRNPTIVDEMIHFNNVGSVHINKRTYRNYSFNNFIEAPEKSIVQNKTTIISKKGNYKLISRAYEYPAKFKLNCLINLNYKNVRYMYGAYNFVDKRLVASSKYWDIQLDELEDQEYARIILPGDAQGLVGRNGTLKITFPILKNGKEVQTSITYIGPFIHGLARINLGGTFGNGEDIKDRNRTTFSIHKLSCNGGLWGYINGDGMVAINIDLEYASDFLDGKAIIKTKGKYGVIDTLNNFIIKPEYDFISLLENSNNKYFKLVKNRRETGILNDKGEIIIKAQYEDMNVQNENRIPIKKNGLWGACDYRGAEIIPFQYDYLASFCEGKSSFKEKNKWGFIDSSGRILKNATYSEVYNFSNGYAAIKEKSKWGFIDSNGNKAIGAIYNKVNSFHNGTAFVYLNKKWWLIDKAGKKISHQWFSKVSDFNQHGLAIVRKKKKNLIVRSDGKMISVGKYKSIGPFSGGLAKVKNKNNKYGFIDTLGKLVIPAVYFNAGDFSEGLVRVRYINSKWGYIDQKNKPKITAEYKSAEDFSEGKATVATTKNVFVIDSFGVKLFELPETTLGKYTESLLLLKGTYYNQQGKKEMGPFQQSTPFRNGIAKVTMLKNNNGVHLINRKNISIANYSQIGEMKDHLAVFSIFNRMGIADVNGNIIAQPVYQSMKYMGNGIFQINRFDEVGYIRNDGVWLWQPTK
jgi:hypothetical protein